MLIATCIADMVEEVLNDLDTNVDAVVGVAVNGVPFASVVAYQYGVELAVMHPGKHQTEIGIHQPVQPNLSENYADVKGKRCVIVDDVITTGSTMEEAIKLIEAGLHEQCNSLVGRYERPEVQVERLMRTRSLSEADAKLRIEAQPPHRKRPHSPMCSLKTTERLRHCARRSSTIGMQSPTPDSHITLQHLTFE
jgi:orotate phosphoribosyltransferase